MASFLSLFSVPQLDLLNDRARLDEKQASSTTGTLVAGDEIGEFYLDDLNALFRTNEISPGDIIEISAGPVSPLGEYTVAGPYYDPRVPARDQVQDENRIIVDGYPTAGGPVTYRILDPTPILEDFASITQNRSFLENVRNPELQTLDDLFLLFLTKFDVVNNLVADTHVALKGLDRPRIDASLLNTSALATNFTVLFPQGYFALQPNRNQTIYTPAQAVDVFNVAVGGSEQAGKNAEVIAEPLSSGGPLLPAYLSALDDQETALNAQEGFLASLEAEVLDNDTPAESGDLNPFYTAMLATITAQRNSIQDRLDDIADIRTADDTRPNVGGLNFGSFGALQAEIDLRSGQLQASPFSDFLDLRFPYLDLIINRAFGTRTEIVSNNELVTFEAQRKQTLLDERTTDRDLLQLP